jgi:hypothetical protein
MNQHLPPSNIRELTIVAPLKSAEQFIVISSTRYGNVSYIEDTVMNRADVIAHVSDDIEHVHQVVAFDLGAGTSRDATTEITSIVFERWAQDCKELTRSQRDAVASFKGEVFANCFRLEEA